MKKLLNLFKNSLIAYLFLYAAGPKTVNTNFASNNKHSQSELDLLNTYSVSVFDNVEDAVDFIRTTITDSNEMVKNTPEFAKQDIHHQHSEELTEQIFFISSKNVINIIMKLYIKNLIMKTYN